MGTVGRAVAIGTGVFLGGGIGFYLKETYYVRIKEKKCAELEAKLQELIRTRKRKEELLRTRKIGGDGEH